ncbi:MAG TPA: metallothionein [Candidatus Binatia bacterium]
MAEKNCAHSTCNCKVQEERAIARGGEMYCSDQCANARTSAGSCGCGHPDCGRKR